jgi:hypothetical protein
MFAGRDVVRLETLVLSRTAGGGLSLARTRINKWDDDVPD